MTDPRREKLSVSVSPQARAYIRAEARARYPSESALVEDAVLRMRREQRQRASREAMIAEATEDGRLANEWDVASPIDID